MLRRTLFPLAAAFALVALTATTVFGASAHFVGTPTATVSGNTLTVSFKAAGLGNADETATFTLSGDVTVNSRCYTKSGNKPQAANKQETIHVSQTDDFPVRNGSVTGQFQVTPLSTLSCPGGQRVVIEGVSYTGLTITGEGLTYTF